MRTLSDDIDSPVESSTEYSYDNNALFVGSYPDSTTEDDISKVFSSKFWFNLGYGPILTIKMIPQVLFVFQRKK